MSWNIFVYAEVKNKKDTEWKPLIENCVCDDFKYYDAGYVDEMLRMKASESSHPSVKELSTGVYGTEFIVSYCYLKDLRSHYYNIIKNFKTKLSAIYIALGMSSLCIEDDEYFNEDEFNDYENDNSDKSFPWIKYMTFPVNKKMFSDLAMSLNEYNKAHQVLGMCDTIASMCEYDDEVRLTFATL